MDDRDILKRKIWDTIIHHVRIHPESADTAIGIVQWWLPPLGFGQAIDVIDEVLDELVAARILRRRALPDGGVIYSALASSTHGSARDLE